MHACIYIYIYIYMSLSICNMHACMHACMHGFVLVQRGLYIRSVVQTFLLVCVQTDALAQAFLQLLCHGETVCTELCWTSMFMHTIHILYTQFLSTAICNQDLILGLKSLKHANQALSKGKLSYVRLTQTAKQIFSPTGCVVSLFELRTRCGCFVFRRRLRRHICLQHFIDESLDNQ